MPGAPRHARPQPDELGDLGLDDLNSPFRRQDAIAAGGVEVQVEPVLPAFSSGTCWNHSGVRSPDGSKIRSSKAARSPGWAW